MDFYQNQNEIGRNCIKSDKNLFARSSPVPFFSLKRMIFSFLSYEIKTGPAEGGAKLVYYTLPVYTSGHGPAVKSEIPRLNSLRKIRLDFIFYF